MNTTICGDVTCPGQWGFPLTEDKQLVNKVIMSNEETQEFIDNLDGFIEELFDEPNLHQNQWLETMASYR